MQIPRRTGIALLIVVPVGLALLGTLSYLAQVFFTGSRPRLNDIVLAQSGWFVCGALAPLVFLASRRWPLTSQHFVRRAALHLALAFVYWSAAGFVFQGLLPEALAALGIGPGPSLAILPRMARWFLSSLPFGALVYFAIVGVEHAMRHFAEGRERATQMIRLEEQLTRSRLSTLQGQVNPHFLFNALNTIAVNARDGDGARTARLVEQLADILRRTLSRDQAHVVSLSEELEIVKHYLALETARFEDRLRVTYDVDEDTLSASVPTFSIQHLAENAVRHGIAARNDSGILHISAHRATGFLEVVVWDDGVGGINGSSKLVGGGGLANTRERLAALYGSEAKLILRSNVPHGAIATLRVPFREVIWERERAGA